MAFETHFPRQALPAEDFVTAVAPALQRCHAAPRSPKALREEALLLFNYLDVHLEASWQRTY